MPNEHQRMNPRRKKIHGCTPEKWTSTDNPVNLKRNKPPPNPREGWTSKDVLKKKPHPPAGACRVSHKKMLQEGRHQQMSPGEWKNIQQPLPWGKNHNQCFPMNGRPWKNHLKKEHPPMFNRGMNLNKGSLTGQVSGDVQSVKEQQQSRNVCGDTLLWWWCPIIWHCKTLAWWIQAWPEVCGNSYQTWSSVFCHWWGICPPIWSWYFGPSTHYYSPNSPKVKITTESVEAIIIHNHLRICIRCLPDGFSGYSQLSRNNNLSARGWLWRCAKKISQHFSKVITQGETWVYHFDIETTAQSMLGLATF